MHFLLFADIIFITAALLLDLPHTMDIFVQLFDLLICFFLLVEWIIRLYCAESKKEFLKEKENWVTLIASIPFEVIIPAVIPGANLLRYIMLFKLLRIMILFNEFFNGFKRFIRKTNLDIILGGIFFTVVIFTALYILFGSSRGMFESFYCVIVTLTTVGYGDIVPVTFNERVITLLLIIIGLFIVSTITAAMSSYLTDRLLSDGEDIMIKDLKDTMEKNNTAIMSELEAIREENKQLRREIEELKKE